MDITIDNLTICGNMAFDNLDHFLNENILITNAIEKGGFSKYPYKEYYSFIDGSMLQIKGLDGKGNNVKDLRYEFNPNNIKKNKVYKDLYMAVLGQMVEPHITRLDIAIDFYGVDMSNWDWIDQKGRPSTVYYSGTGNIETYYIGGKSSDLKIRIYNKAKEQKRDDIIWWRVELQMRGDYIKKWMLGDSNPFDGVIPTPNTASYSELNVKKRAMLYFLECFLMSLQTYQHQAEGNIKN